MLLKNVFSKYGKTLWSGTRRRSLRHAKIQTVLSAEVLEERKLLTTVFGDFNGDGIQDEAVGLPDATVNGHAKAGSVGVLYGSSDGELAPVGKQVWNQDSNGIRGGAEAGDQFGYSLAVGDFNADGYDDLAIGVPFENIEQTLNFDEQDAGAVNIIFGSGLGLHHIANAENQLWTQNTRGVLGESNDDDQFGKVLSVGDYNHDGIDDLAIAVPRDGIKPFLDFNPFFGRGGVNILYGSSDSRTIGNIMLYLDQGDGIEGKVEDNDFFGSSLATGDFNGDGKDDLAIGVPGDVVGEIEDAGAVNVIYNGQNGLSDVGDQIWHRNSSGVPGNAGRFESFGSSVVAGDFNNDGFDDLAFGVPGAEISGIESAGEIVVIYGSKDKLQATTENGAVIKVQTWNRGSSGVFGTLQSDERFGGTLNVQDVNGDGYVDLRIGALPFSVDSQDEIVLYGTANGIQARDPELFSTGLSVGASQELSEVDSPSVEFPAAPIIITPGATTTDTTPSITWSAINGADTYEIQLYDVAAGQLLESKSNLKTTSFTVESELTVGRDYQLFIRGLKSNGELGNFAKHEFTVTTNSISPNESIINSLSVVFTTATIQSTVFTATSTQTSVFTATTTQNPIFTVATTRTPGFGDPPTVTNPGRVTKEFQPLIAWTAVPGAVGYDLSVVDLDRSGSVIYEQNLLNNEFLPERPLRPDHYRVQTRARFIDGKLSGWSQPYDFFIGEVQIPSAPKILTPFPISNDTTPKISWTSVNDAASYELLVYDLDRGIEIVSEKNLQDTSYTPQQELLGSRTYQVFVRGINLNGEAGTWSKPYHFQIEQLQFPSAPILTGPHPLTTDLTPEIEWIAVAGAARYEILLYDIAAGALVIGNNNITQPSFTPSVELSYGRDYQVFVRAIDANGKLGEFSEAHEFRPQEVQSPDFQPSGNTFENEGSTSEFVVDDTVNNTTTEFATNLIVSETSIVTFASQNVQEDEAEQNNLALQAPVVPELVSPGEIVSDLTPLISWNPVDFASAYELHVYDISAGQQIISESLNGTSFTPSKHLTVGRNYQIFVRAINATGETSSWSTPIEFNVVEQPTLHLDLVFSQPVKLFV